MIKKILLANLLNSVLIVANADNTANWINASSYYQKSNLNALQQLSDNNPEDKILGYMFSIASIDKMNTTPAEFFIDGKRDYLATDIRHRLLTYNFNNQNWAKYIVTYKGLTDSQSSLNEDCGYDLANFALNNKVAPAVNYNELIRNKMPLWCISLVTSKLANNKLNIDKNILLFNLIINGQTAQFQQVAKSLNVDPSLNSNSLNQTSYQIVNRIANLANKSPDGAFYELNQSNADAQTKQYLNNYLAYILASKQMFELSSVAIKNGNNIALSDDEYEWRVRTFLALNQWQAIIDTINQMPNSLQNKNAWIYWKAFSLSKLNQKKAASDQLKKIPLALNYYSLLTQSELNTSINTKQRVLASNFNNIKESANASLGFNIYATGKQHNIGLYTKLGTQIIYQAINNSNDQDIAAISDRAYSLNMTDVAIYAATKMNQPDASRAFPMLYVDLYEKYSAMYNVDPIFPIAITRQESRFNPNALAFDGGVGLMQIMPATAASIAKKIGSSNCYKNYVCNIQFGTWFLAHLAQKFDGNLIYASAGYNAGPGRAHRWQQAFNAMDNQIQVELIPFKITRDYVQKILTNKLVYDTLIEKQSLNMNAYLQKINNKDTVYITDDSDNASAVINTAPLPNTDNQ